MDIISPFTPKDWRQLRLRDISRISSGTTPPRSMSDKYFSLSGTNWLKTMDLNNTEITSTEEKLTDAAFEDCSIQIYEKNTIFVAMYGGFKQIGRTGIGKIQLTVNQAISAITITDSEVEPKYIQHWLNSRINGWRRFAASSRKDPNITRTDVLAFPVALPYKAEQIAICKMVLHWDNAIVIYEKLLTAKIELRKGLMQQLLSGKQRFPEFGKPKKDGERVPKDWALPKTEEVFKNCSTKNHPEEIVLSVTQDQGVVPRNELARRINADKSNTATYKLVRAGDFVISLRSFQGGLEYSNYRGLVSPAYHVIRPKKEVSHDYYRHYFKSPEFIKRLAVAVIGIRDGKQISYGDFSFMHIPVPSFEEQKKIAETLNKADEEIALLQKQLEVLKLQKKGLMQQLLTGKKRVKVKDVA